MKTQPKIKVASLEKEITPVVLKADKITITNNTEMVEATKLLSNINKYADEVESRRKAITEPLNVALKAARQMFSPLEDKLEAAITSIRKAMTSYQTNIVRIQKEEEAKIAARIGEGKGKLKLETAVAKMDQIEKPVEKITTDAGAVKFKTVKKFRIIDKRYIPFDYLLPDEVAIRKAMLSDIKIEGVEYYEEQVPVNSR